MKEAKDKPVVALVRDVLDNQIVDVNGRRLAKVDGIVLVQDGDEPPRVAYLEVGAETLARRIHLSLAGVVRRISRRWGLHGGEPYRIPVSDVRCFGIDVRVGFDGEASPLMDWEHWVEHRIIRRLPWG